MGEVLIKKMSVSILIVFMINLCPLVTAQAEPYKEACVKYQRQDYSWSDSYKVKGIIMSGSELNDIARRNSYRSDYTSYKYYYVIPWQEGGYTALEIPYGSSLPSLELNTKDQRDTTWSLKEGWNFCGSLFN